MTEDEYVFSSNLAKIKMARTIICDIFIEINDPEHEKFIDLLILIDEWQDKFYKKLGKLKVNKSFKAAGKKVPASEANASHQPTPPTHQL